MSRQTEPRESLERVKYRGATKGPTRTRFCLSRGLPTPNQRDWGLVVESHRIMEYSIVYRAVFPSSTAKLEDMRKSALLLLFVLPILGASVRSVASHLETPPAEDRAVPEPLNWQPRDDSRKRSLSFWEDECA